MDIYELHDEAIKNALADFEKLDPGSSAALNQARAIEALMKALTEKAKLDIAKEEHLRQEEFEGERLDIEAKRLDTEQRLQVIEDEKSIREANLAKLQLAFEAGKLLVLIGFIAVQTAGVMHFEETGILRSNAWKLLPGMSKMIKI